MHALEKDCMEPAGILKIGAPVEFGGIYLPHVISTFRDLCDDVTFDLELGRSSLLLAKVDSGALDFAFVDTFPAGNRYIGDSGSFSVTAVIEDNVVPACSRKYLALSFRTCCGQSSISGTRRHL